MKKMTRFLALVTVLVLMLSMSVTAFAAPRPHSATPCPDHGTVLKCTEHPGMVHRYVLSFDGLDYEACYFNESGEFGGHKKIYYEECRESHVTPEIGKMYAGKNENLVLCNNGAPIAQPKTGVMDTLPLWFGVMAVSACAYILTSKKKVF